MSHHLKPFVSGIHSVCRQIVVDHPAVVQVVAVLRWAVLTLQAEAGLGRQLVLGHGLDGGGSSNSFGQSRQLRAA